MAALAAPLTPRIGALTNPVVGVARAPQIGGFDTPRTRTPKQQVAPRIGGQFGGGIVWGAGWGRVGPPRTAWGEGSVEQVQRSKLGRVPTPADGVALGAYAGDDVSRGADLRRGSACPLGTSTRRVLHRTARGGNEPTPAPGRPPCRTGATGNVGFERERGGCGGLRGGVEGARNPCWRWRRVRLGNRPAMPGRIDQ